MDPSFFLREAIKLAHEKMLARCGGPFGAVIVRHGTIIGRGWNQVTSTHDPTAHAEIVAIREACQHLGSFQLNDCTIFTNCEPCPMCLSAIYWARIPTVHYAATRHDAAAIGFADEFLYQEICRPSEARSVRMVQSRREEALVSFSAWESLEGKIPY